jgi:cob(I)alamin adenosyltransferase
MRERHEPVRLTKIYTRGGDSGETSLGDGSRVSKLHPRVRAMGDVDELNSLIGWALIAAPSDPLRRVQNELFDLGADVSVPFVEGDGKLRVELPLIDRLEADCDDANARLEPLKSFVLPGGSEAAARLYVARAVCRRAERSVRAVDDVNPLASVYLNRLSDLLFILARTANAGDEPLWRPGSYTSSDGDDTAA